MNSLSIWAWMFLFGHLVCATGVMCAHCARGPEQPYEKLKLEDL